MCKKRAVISVSGGMDSTGLLVNLLTKGYEKIYALSFFYGQKHSVELDRVKKNMQYLIDNDIEVEHQIIDLSPIMGLYESALTSDNIDVPEGHYEQENMRVTVVPNRNAIFSSLVYGYALSIATRFDCDVDIALGVHSGDHAIYPDCRPEFYEAIENTFKIGNWDSEKIHFYLPYLNGNKLSILEDTQTNCKELNIDFNTIFKNTNTCYKPTKDGESCGNCGSCTERLEAFEELGISDPVPYVKGE
jgi:7-cyano-7-deazaguanine synthase